MGGRIYVKLLLVRAEGWRVQEVGGDAVAATVVLLPRDSFSHGTDLVL